MGKCVIIGAGELFGDVKLDTGDYLIAADGGLDHIKSLGLTPDVIIGDFDSVSDAREMPEGIEVIRHPVEKDETDSYLAYRLGYERGFREFHIFGGTGGREDHTFANYCLLLKAKNEGCNAFLYGKDQISTVIKNEKMRIFGNPGASFSVFALGVIASGVTVKGAKYEAEKVTLTPDFPLGVSNSFTDSGYADIEAECGALLIMQAI